MQIRSCLKCCYSIASLIYHVSNTAYAIMIYTSHQVELSRRLKAFCLGLDVILQIQFYRFCKAVWRETRDLRTEWWSLPILVNYPTWFDPAMKFCFKTQSDLKTNPSIYWIRHGHNKVIVSEQYWNKSWSILILVCVIEVRRVTLLNVVYTFVKDLINLAFCMLPLTLMYILSC